MRFTKLLTLTVVLAFTLIHTTCLGQKILIRNERSGNQVYRGFMNPMSILVQEHACESLVIKAKTGSVELADGCRFNYFNASKNGIDSIFVFERKNNNLKRLGATIVWVREPPLPIATVGGFANGDSISPGVFKAQAGVGTDQCCGMESTHIVTSFHLIVIRNGKIIFDKGHVGNSFSGVGDIIQQLGTGDKILIGDIIAKGGDGKDSNLLPVQYILK
jgi:hypothetical protein